MMSNQKVMNLRKVGSLETDQPTSSCWKTLEWGVGGQRANADGNHKRGARGEGRGKATRGSTLER